MKKISKINDGVVIDHIRPGLALTIAKLLKLDMLDLHFSIGSRHFSNKQKLKDYIKIEDYELSTDQLNCVWFISPSATVNDIEGGSVAIKSSGPAAGYIKGIVKCPDPECITNYEDVETKFWIIDQKTLKCHYCETEFYDKLIQLRE